MSKYIKMKKIALFARVSTLKQTLEQQVDELVKVAEKEGYSKRQQVIIQEKESARKLKYDARKTLTELEEMIDDIDCVVVYELSRLSRRSDVMYQVRDLLIQHKVQLICLQPYMRLLDEKGEMTQSASLIFSIFTSLAESEMDLKIARMKRGKEHKMNQNRYGGGGVAFGYKVEDDKIVVNEEQANVIRRIYSIAIERDISARQIARELLDEGVLEQSKYSAACMFVSSVLRRKDYCGIGGRTNYQYPAIISEETYNKARKKIDIYGPRTRQKSVTKNKYYGRKMVYDKVTGDMLSCIKEWWGMRYSNCSAWGRQGVGVNALLVDSLLWYCTVRHKNRLENVIGIRKQLGQEIVEYGKKIDTGRKTLKELEMKIDRINERIISGKMSEGRGDAMISDIQQEMKRIEKNCLEWVMNLNQKNDILQDLINGNGFDCSDIESDVERIKLIKSEISRVNVLKERRYAGQLEVVYRDGEIETYSYNWNPRTRTVTHKGKNVYFPILNHF